MDALIVFSLFLGLAAASLRWGHDSRFGDSRFGLGDVSFDDVEAHVRALHQQALVEALVRAAPERTARPALHRRALGGAGALMVALGRRLEGYGERIVVPSQLAATSDCSIQRGL
ncbi:MAG TPA: hypothetical protein VG370_23105 [Chloroflexota bacterium]|nr:hypothetical protein [Chloroflexota bacterium]